MIKEIKSFQECKNFINEISVDFCFSDPHFLNDESNLYDAFKKENQKAYGVFKKGKLIGLFVWLIIPNEKYIELIVGLSRSEEVYEEMLAFIEKKYPKFKIDFVINPLNQVFINVLSKRNAKFDKEQQKMVWTKTPLVNSDLDIKLNSLEYEEQYKTLHTKEGYWTADKVLKAQDKFRVLLAIANKKVIGYLDVTHCCEENEIYSLFVLDDFKGLGYEQALLSKEIKFNHSKGLMVFVEVDSTKEIEIYEDAGFRKVNGLNSIYVTYIS